MVSQWLSLRYNSVLGTLGANPRDFKIRLVHNQHPHNTAFRGFCLLHQRKSHPKLFQNFSTCTKTRISNLTSTKYVPKIHKT